MSDLDSIKFWTDYMIKKLEPCPLLTALQEDMKWKDSIIKSHLNPVEEFFLRNTRIKPLEHWILKRFKVIHEEKGIEIYENGCLIGEKKFFIIDQLEWLADQANETYKKVEIMRLDEIPDQEKKAMLYGDWGKPI